MEKMPWDGAVPEPYNVDKTVFTETGRDYTYSKTYNTWKEALAAADLRAKKFSKTSEWLDEGFVCGSFRDLFTEDGIAGYQHLAIALEKGK